MLRVTSLLSTCALLAAVGCNTGDKVNAAPADNAPEDKLVHKADGSVQYKGLTYDSMSSFFRSPAFRANPGLRCGTTRQAPVANATPDDCTFTFTNPADEYNASGGAEVYEVEVIFHVILDQTPGAGPIPDAPGYVSPARVVEQMRVLNYDFRAREGTPGGTAIAADSAIQFKLATDYPDVYPQDPTMQGMPLPDVGVLYIESPNFYVDGDSGTPSDMKTALHWDTSKYLNIYVNNASGALGYSYFPQWIPAEPFPQEDGIVMLTCTIGGDMLNDPNCAPYELGRTLTHEVGHWVGLFHTFQDGCGDGYTGGDLVADTHPESGPNFGCPLQPGTSCGNEARPDPIENYMDYSDDICMTRYTREQINRARCSVENYRPQIDTDPDNFLPDPGFTFMKNFVTFDFTDASTDQAGTITDWSWDFGDGNVSTDQNPSHMYAAEGIFNVTLTVTDNDGNRIAYTEEIVAGEPPRSQFSFTTDGLYGYFTDESTDVAPGTVARWVWDFGDGGTSTEQSPLHAYGAAGVYTVTLTVYDNSDLPNAYAIDITIGEPPLPEFEAQVDALDVAFTDTSTTPNGTIDTWMWDFGDGNTSDMQSPNYSYTAGGLYNVTLMVRTDQGDSNSYQRNVLVNARPAVGFDALVDYLDVTFTDTTTDPDSERLEWWWDFGDGSFSADQNPMHTYEYASDWAVTLTVTDRFGNEAMFEQTVSTMFAPQPDAGFVDPTDPDNPVNGGDTNGCVCTVGQTEKGAPWPAAALFLGLGLFILRRRRAS